MVISSNDYSHINAANVPVLSIKIVMKGIATFNLLNLLHILWARNLG